MWLKLTPSLCWLWLGRAAEELEGIMHQLCQILMHRVGSPLLTAITWWLLLNLLWVLAFVLEQPSWLPAGHAAF